MKHIPRKRFGQHFLVDDVVIDAIVRAIDPKPGEALVEIGPGLGAMTGPLLERCEHLTVIEVDRDLCIGAQSCALIAPKTFSLDDQGKVLVLDGPHDDDATVIAAAESCPVRAIMLKRRDGRKIV